MATSQTAATGSFSKNQKKQQPNHPDYTGSITTQEAIPAGTKLYLSIWQKTDDRGKNWCSMNVQFPFEQQQQRSTGGQRGGYSKNSAPPQQEDLDDDIPF